MQLQVQVQVQVRLPVDVAGLGRHTLCSQLKQATATLWNPDAESEERGMRAAAIKTKGEERKTSETTRAGDDGGGFLVSGRVEVENGLSGLL